MTDEGADLIRDVTSVVLRFSLPKGSERLAHLAAEHMCFAAAVPGLRQFRRYRVTSADDLWRMVERKRKPLQNILSEVRRLQMYQQTGPKSPLFTQYDRTLN